jgi:hypothetical protein
MDLRMAGLGADSPVAECASHGQAAKKLIKNLLIDRF